MLWTHIYAGKDMFNFLLNITYMNPVFSENASVKV
jgi:hypothetical protein